MNTNDQSIENEESRKDLKNSDVILRVLDLDETTSFAVNTVLLHRQSLDPTQFPYISPNSVFVVVNPVPVYSETAQLLGFATVEEEAARLSAVIRIARDCPERLEIETRSRDLYAGLAAKTIEFATVGGRFVGTKVVVESIELTTKPPFDLLVRPLGDVIL
jgi:hypothetical protein